MIRKRSECLLVWKSDVRIFAEDILKTMNGFFDNLPLSIAYRVILKNGLDYNIRKSCHDAIHSVAPEAKYLQNWPFVFSVIFPTLNSLGGFVSGILDLALSNRFSEEEILKLRKSSLSDKNIKIAFLEIMNEYFPE